MGPKYVQNRAEKWPNSFCKQGPKEDSAEPRIGPKPGPYLGPVWAPTGGSSRPNPAVQKGGPDGTVTADREAGW